MNKAEAEIARVQHALALRAKARWLRELARTQRNQAVVSEREADDTERELTTLLQATDGQ